jgi:hypothetical protein
LATQTQNRYFWWPCAKSLGGSLDFLFPAGWAGIGGNGPTDGPGVVASGVGEPYIVMMRKAESLVILMRGTNRCARSARCNNTTSRQLRRLQLFSTSTSALSKPKAAHLNQFAPFRRPYQP